MKAKFSKRLLSLFLSLLMIVTSVPMAALTAFAADVKTHSFDIQVADWDFTKGGYSSFKSVDNNSYSPVPQRDSVNNLAMYNRTWNVSWAYDSAKGGAYTSDGYMFYDNMGKYLSNDCGVKISFNLSITENKGHDYGLFSLGTGHAGSGFYNIINIHKDGAVYYGGATSASCNVGALNVGDYSVEIVRTTSGSLYFTCNGTRYNLTDNCTFSPSQFNHLALGVCQDGAYPGIVVKDVKVAMTASDSKEQSASAVTAAMQAFENKIKDGNIYTGLANAYQAYVECREALDAVQLGGRTDVDYSYAAAKLTAYTNAMSVWSRQTDRDAKSHYLKSDNNVESNPEVTYGTESGLMYADNVVSGTEVSANTVQKQVYMRHPSVTMLYDGTTALTAPIMLVVQSTNNKLRYFKLSTIDNAEFELTEHWKGVQNSANNWDYGGARVSSNSKYLVPKDTPTSSMRLSQARGAKGSGITNIIRFKGTFAQNEFLKTLYPTVTSYGDGANDDVINGDAPTVVTSKTPIYVVNYKAVLDVLASDYVKNVYANVASYKEGGLKTFFESLDALTALDINSYFGDNSGAAALASAIETPYNAVYNESNRTADSFDTLRDAMNTHTYKNQEGTQTALQVYNANGRGFDTTKQTYADFRASYETAKAVFANAYTAGYSGDAAAMASDLIAKFDAIEIKEITVPTIVPSSTTLGVTDTVTVTIPDGCTGQYTIEYSDGATVTDTLAAGNNTLAIFADKTNVTTAKLSAHTIMGGEESTDATATYKLLQAPEFSVQNNESILPEREVRLSSVNDVASTIQYSYTGNDGDFVNYEGAVKPFVDNADAIYVTIYAREVYTDAASGRTSYSTVTSVNVVVNGSFSFYLTDASGNAKSGNHFAAADKIYLSNINKYTNPVYYMATVDGVAQAMKPYDKDAGISCSDFSGATIVSITAYATDQQNVTLAEGDFYNESYNTLVYAESFDGAKIDGATLTTGSATGINGTGIANTLTVLNGYGTAVDANGNTCDYRQNVLKIAAGANNPGNVVTMASNPLAKSDAALVAKQNGVTISFWRTFGAQATGSDWIPALSFTDENDKNYYLQIMGTGISSFNQGANAGVGGSYIDLMPQFQDPTTHTTGNKRNIWIHFAITISPDGEIVVYANGEPHRWAVWDDGGQHKGGDYATIDNMDTSKDTLNNAKLANDILAFLTKSSTQFRLCDGGDWNRNYVDLYLDDIRIYTETFTQADINNMYNDGDFPDQYNNASVGHDPTAVTVYTLAGGTYTSTDGTSVTESAGKTVGQEFIDYYNVDVKNPAQVSDIDYYIFGTGMTIYHSDDNVNWTVVGDSKGRTGYQNQQLYGGLYTTAIKEQLDYARHTTGGHTGQWQEPSSGAGYLQWAPHVMYNLNADCWQYYGSTSSWGAMDSCIFTGNAQNITGPYNNIKTVFASCANTKTTTTIANAIDACVYYGRNADGTINPNALYLLYGSWQPTYVIKLDPTSGQYVHFNKADPYGQNFDSSKLDAGYNYYGKMIIDSTFSGEGSGSGEGGYMVYQKHADGKGYYYLYVSLGSNSGNYQLRMFRSESPDGGFTAYGGQSATDTSTNTHGMSFLSSYQLPVYDYAYTSVGHNSVYKALNKDGKIVTVDSVHARTFSSKASRNGLVAMQDGGMITRQVDHTGNISIQNMIAYTKEGWQVAFPLQYNGTDTTVNTKSADGRFTAHDLEGVYSFNDLLRDADYNYARTQQLTMIPKSDTEAVVYTGSVSQQLTLSYGTDYAGDPITYISMTGVGGTYQGVVGRQTNADGEDVMQFSWFQEDPSNRHLFTWGYKSADMPKKDLESPGDFVHNNGVIYTRSNSTEKGTFSDYGQQISDDPNFAVTGERVTKIATDYPCIIDVNDPMAVYCMSDEDFARDGYTGGSYKVVDMYNSWVIKNANGEYEPITDEQAANEYSGTARRIYYLQGFVSNYFHYHTGADCPVDGNTGAKVGYPEYGVRMAITWKSLNPNLTNKRETGGEYQFFYVAPNPASAHTIVGLRNTKRDEFAGITTNDRRVNVLLYTRLAGSEGLATRIPSDALANQDTDTENILAGKSNNGIGTFKYIGTFPDYESVGDGKFGYNADQNADGTYIHENVTWNYTAPELIAKKFNFRDETQGQNAGSYNVVEYDNQNANVQYRYTTPVDANYFIDYSDADNQFITWQKDESGNLLPNAKPTGYQFQMLASNLWWNTKAKQSSIQDMTSYYRNDTGLDVKFEVTTKNEIGTKDDVSTAIDYRAQNDGKVNNADFLTRGYSTTAFADILKDSQGNLNRGFDNISNGRGANNDWNGQITFTGKDTVNNNNRDTSSAEKYANFVLEHGLVKTITGVGQKWYAPLNTYQFYNIGVHTCDKGAVRSFLETFENKELNVEVNKETGEILKVTAGKDINVGEYTVASYEAYIKALSEAYFFLYNNKNTTYNVDADGNYSAANSTTGQFEYVTAYTSEQSATAYKPAGSAVYNSSTAGSPADTDIFGTGTGVVTDPVQTMITDSVIEAYNNLYKITEYQEAQEKCLPIIKAAADKDLSKYTESSKANYEALMVEITDSNNKIPYFDYKTDNTAEGQDDYWRYVELDGEEYRALAEAVKGVDAGLMPKVETAGLDAQMTEKSQLLLEGIGTADNQTRTIGSWKALKDEIDNGQKCLDAITDDANKIDGFEPGKHAVTATETYTTPAGKEIKYQIWDESTNSAVQQDIYDETPILEAKKYDLVDDQDRYDNFNAAAELLETIDMKKFTTDGQQKIKDCVAQFRYGQDKNVLRPDGAHVDYVYASSALIDEYNKTMKNVDGFVEIQPDALLKNTPQTETDLFTKMLLELTSQNINRYDAFLVVQDADQNVISALTKVQSKDYGEMFELSIPDVPANEAVYWSVAIYGNGDCTLNEETGMISGKQTSSQKVSANNTATLERKADADIVVTAVVSNAAAENNYKVVVKDIYGKTADVKYVTNVADVTASGNTVTIGGAAIERSVIPFYNFSKWSIDTSKAESDRIIVVKPVYSAQGTSAYEVVGGTVSAKGSAPQTSIENVPYDTLVKVTADAELTNFWAWAVKTADGKYQIVSYNRDATFYSVVDGKEYYVAIVQDVVDGKTVYRPKDNEAATLDTSNVANALPTNYDGKDSTAKLGNMTAEEFLIDKLTRKAPFVYIERAVKNTEFTRAYVRVTQGVSDSMLTGYGVEIKKASDGTVLSKPCNNILETGQFTVTARRPSTPIDFSAYVTYDFAYTNEDGTAYSIAAIDKTVYVTPTDVENA